MKLIDELIHELPKIGGWPERAVAAMRINNEGFIRFRTKESDFNWLPHCLGGEAGTVTREQYEQELERIENITELNMNINSDFDTAARSLMKWINDNGHPHQTIIIDATSAVLYSGEKSITTEEFIKD